MDMDMDIDIDMDTDMDKQLYLGKSEAELNVGHTVTHQKDGKRQRGKTSSPTMQKPH
jgi:hypothetical protein